MMCCTPTLAPPKLTEIGAKLAAQYKVQDSKQVVVFGLKTAFGGGKSTGFALIYDTLQVRAAAGAVVHDECVVFKIHSA